MHTHGLRTDALFPDVPQPPEVGYFSIFLGTLGITFPRIPHPYMVWVRDANSGVGDDLEPGSEVVVILI